MTPSKVSWLSVHYVTSHSWHYWCLEPMIIEAALKHQVHEEFHLGPGQEVVKGVRSLPSKLSNGRSHPAQQVLHKTPQSLFQFKHLALRGSVNPWVISAVIPWLLVPLRRPDSHMDRENTTPFQSSLLWGLLRAPPLALAELSHAGLQQTPQGTFTETRVQQQILSCLS